MLLRAVLDNDFGQAEAMLLAGANPDHEVLKDGMAFPLLSVSMFTHEPALTQLLLTHGANPGGRWAWQVGTAHGRIPGLC